jgi:CRP-like cAMP-binding protein
MIVFTLLLPVLLQPNEVIISQGERGDDFYIVESGVFDVMVASSPEQLEALAIEEQLQQQDLLELQPQQQDLAAKLQQQQIGNGQQQQQAAAAGSSSSGTPKAAGLQQQQQQQGKSSGGGLVASRGPGNLLVDNDLMAGAQLIRESIVRFTTTVVKMVCLICTASLLLARWGHAEGAFD